MVKRGEALANFERGLIIRFPQVSKAAALHAKARLGGARKALGMYCRVGATTSGYKWVDPTAEKKVALS